MAAKNDNNRQREVGEEPFAAVDAQSRPKQARRFVYNQSEDFWWVLIRRSFLS